MKTIKTSITSTGNLLYLKSTLWATILGSVSIILMLIIISAILLISGTLPHEYLVWLDIAACAIGSYVAGYTASRITKHNALLSGVLSGGAIFIILLIAGFIFGNSLTYIILIKFAVILLSALIGAIKGVNKKEKIRIK